jgi:putative transposase
MMQMTGCHGLERRRGPVSLLRYHVVFTTKYRRKVTTARVLETILGAFDDACTSNGWTIYEVNGPADHVHMLLGLPPRTSLADAVRVLKTNSSHAVRLCDFPEVRRRLWGSAFWSPSYFAVTCGGAPLDVIRRYIENQKTPLS